MRTSGTSKQQINSHSMLEQMLKNECAALRECDRGPLSSGSVLAYWMEKVAQWFYDVVDHLGQSRSVVYSPRKETIHKEEGTLTPPAQTPVTSQQAAPTQMPPLSREEISLLSSCPLAIYYIAKQRQNLSQNF
jgi:hypothetical protein